MCTMAPKNPYKYININKKEEKKKQKHKHYLWLFIEPWQIPFYNFLQTEIRIFFESSPKKQMVNTTILCNHKFSFILTMIYSWKPNSYLNNKSHVNLLLEYLSLLLEGWLPLLIGNQRSIPSALSSGSQLTATPTPASSSSLCGPSAFMCIYPRPQQIQT